VDPRGIGETRTSPVPDDIHENLLENQIEVEFHVVAERILLTESRRLRSHQPNNSLKLPFRVNSM
jgi:hypothetical protein